MTNTRVDRETKALVARFGELRVRHPEWANAAIHGASSCHMAMCCFAFVLTWLMLCTAMSSISLDFVKLIKELADEKQSGAGAPCRASWPHGFPIVVCSANC